jgi:hypothetical protein
VTSNKQQMLPLSSALIAILTLSSYSVCIPGNRKWRIAHGISDIEAKMNGKMFTGWPRSFTVTVKEGWKSWGGWPKEDITFGNLKGPINHMCTGGADITTDCLNVLKEKNLWGPNGEITGKLNCKQGEVYITIQPTSKAVYRITCNDKEALPTILSSQADPTHTGWNPWNACVPAQTARIVGIYMPNAFYAKLSRFKVTIKEKKVKSCRDTQDGCLDSYVEGSGFMGGMAFPCFETLEGCSSDSELVCKESAGAGKCTPHLEGWALAKLKEGRR